MRNDEKLNVMEAGDVLDIRDRTRKATSTPITPLTARGPYQMPRRDASAASAPGTAPTMHYALLLGLTWLLGPAALLLTPDGRRHHGWLTLGIASALAGALITLVPYSRFVPVTTLATPLAWSTLAVLATIGGFSAWARAVQFAAAQVPPPHRQNRWLRSRPAVCVLGLVAPGCGMLVGGNRWHASLWLWALWPAALGVAVLRNAMDMWRHLATTVPDRAAADLLEFSILMAAAAVVLGALAWLVQALEGARRLAPAPALARGHGDWFAVALGVSCAALAVAGNPERAARNLGDAALVLQAEGFSVIPLQLSLAADRLDSAHAEYAVTAIALHEIRGDEQGAKALRERLDRSLAPYVALLDASAARPGSDGESVPSPSSRAADPSRPGTGELYYGTLARARPAGGR
jgi:hypothetical protein